MRDDFELCRSVIALNRREKRGKAERERDKAIFGWKMREIFQFVGLEQTATEQTGRKRRERRRRRKKYASS